MTKRGPVWYGRLYQNGKERRVRLGRDYTKACAKWRRIKREGAPEKPARPMTINDAWPRWLASYVATARNERNQRDAKARAKRYLSPALGSIALGRLTEDDLRAYRLHLERAELAPQTVGHILSDVRCMLGWCVRCGWLDRSPFPRRLLPKVPERAPDRLTEAQTQAVCSTPDPYGFACRLALATGLRWGELVKVQAADVQDGVLAVTQPKTGKRVDVPLPPAMLAELRGRVGLLVPYQHSQNFNRRVRQLSGVEDFRVHRLRHTFACRWLERGGSIEKLRQILGHSTVRMTERYGKVSRRELIEEARRVYGE